MIHDIKNPNMYELESINNNDNVKKIYSINKENAQDRELKNDYKSG